MEYPEFQNLVVASAQMYLDYLDRAPGFRGMKVVSVYSIVSTATQSEYLLTLSEKLRNPDTCEFWIDGEPVKQVEISKVMQERSRIIIRDKSGLLARLDPLSPDRIKLTSDMRFLIRRLKAFYSGHTFSFHPPAPVPLPELPEELSSGLSEEQLSAVNGVCSSSVSYVNGAPGTGKTNMVLSRCVLRYVLNGKRVFLLAPTNNAVEQMLRGILPTLQSSGIPLERVYRLGTSSEEFARQYPQVVGDTATESLMESLTQQRDSLLSEISAAERMNADCEQKRIRLEKCEKSLDAIRPLLDELRTCREALSRSSFEAAEAERQLVSCKASHSRLEVLTAQFAADLHAREKIIQDNTALSNRLSYRIFKRDKYRQLISETAVLQSELTGLKIKHEKLLSELASSSNKVSNASILFDKARQKCDSLKSQQASLSNSILSISGSDSQFRSLIMPLLIKNDNSDSLNHFLESVRSEYEESIKAAQSCSIPDMKSALEKVNRQLEEIGSTAKQMQKKSALVLSGTIDASLYSLAPDSRDEPGMPVSHVFLDEAGYTSLARGMAAFSCNAPVTFLGDHNQLPPVCEMNRIDRDHAPVCLWSIPVAYYSELVHGNFPDLYNSCYRFEKEPSFFGVDFYSLNVSYRFGVGLAEILSRHFYSGKLSGVGRSDFSVDVIHADYSPGPHKRSNISETKVIAKYLSHNHPSDFAILTPYNGQQKLLRQMLPRDYADFILTVHRSQGREWDTVIFSVSDAQNMYFTDSLLPIGRRIINTAISRTKRKLVIVCDTNVWENHPEQVICDLLHCGNLISQ